MSDGEASPGGRARRRTASAIVAAALASVPLAAAPANVPAGPPATGQLRPLQVERPGVVRLALPAAGYPPQAGFRVLGPDGAAVPVRLLVLDGSSDRHAARVVAVTPEADGWSLLIDAGPSAPPHQGLHLPLAVAGLAQVELEASSDRRHWTPLASASLFRLGHGAELQGTALAYPATTARYLRLRWPAASGFPRLAQVELEPVAAAAEEQELPAGACTAAGARHTVCDLAALGDRAVDGLVLSLPAGAAAGWQLRGATAGRWELLGEGTWAPLPAEAARRVPAGGRSGPLRLELWGEAAPPTPRLVARLLPLALELTVTQPGFYELRSAPDLPRQPAVSAAATAADAQWLVPGEPRPVPPAPPLALAAGGTLPKVSFRRHWPVRVDATPGEAVRLPLPAAVEAASRGDLGDLRLARQGQQVAFLIDDAATPERLGAWERLVLRPQVHGISGAEIPLPEGARGGELLLRVPARPLRRDVRLVRRGVAEGLAEAPPVETSWMSWQCEPLPPLPCELELPLPDGGRGPLRVEIADGDNAPLAELSAEAWRPRRELLFPWPGAPVALLAGAPELQPPAYDLAAVAAELRARPARRAKLGPPAEGWVGAPARFPRWAVLASLALAAATLLLLLARALPRMPETR
ncbi:MAG TPA: DUF3999 family protein [Thermoanaerobaculia bacterium]|nr:DUF3999 family protein [Thermoanaerobaculia bacterium]